MADPVPALSSLIQFDLATAIKAGRDQVQIIKVDDDHRPHVSYPKEHTLVKIADEKLAKPRFFTANPKFHQPDAFIAYVNKYKDADTRIFFSDAGVFVAVLDYHRVGDARHGDHTATLELERSPEWEIWSKASGTPMTQIEFAEFIEDNISDITHPTGVEMLEVASGLQATSNATFKSAVNQANGTASFQFDEVVDGQVKGTAKPVPTIFNIALRPFMGTAPYPVECRFRYRIPSGRLQMWFKALRLDPITDDALTNVVGVIKEATEINPASGAHDAAAFKIGQ